MGAHINALLENEKLAAAVLEYDAFTDIEFNPDRSLNCQAKAAACFVGLRRAGLTEKMKTFGDVCGTVWTGTEGAGAVRGDRDEAGDGGEDWRQNQT